MTFFRNVTMFRFPLSLDYGHRVVDAALAECRLKPVGPMELSAQGFVSPFAGDDPALSHRIDLSHRMGAAIWLTVGGEDRILPGAVINDLLAKKVAAVNAAEGRSVGGRARKRIRDDLILELLPRTLVRPSRTDAIIDRTHGVLFVDSASRGVAESVVSEIRHALGSFPALPLDADIRPRAVLTGWVAGESLPENLTIGDECELRDPTDRGVVVKVQGMELDSDEVKKHLQAGKQVTRLALVLDDHVSFVLDEHLTVRKLKLLDGAIDALDDVEHDDVRAEQTARMALMTGEVMRLFDVLERTFQISKADA